MLLHAEDVGEVVLTSRFDRARHSATGMVPLLFEYPIADGLVAFVALCPVAFSGVGGKPFSEGMTFWSSVVSADGPGEVVEHSDKYMCAMNTAYPRQPFRRKCSVRSAWVTVK